MVGWLQCNHALRRAHDRFYLRDRKFVAERDAHMLTIMEILDNATEFRLHAGEYFYRLVDSAFRLMDGSSDVIHVKDLLREERTRGWKTGG